MGDVKLLRLLHDFITIVVVVATAIVLCRPHYDTFRVPGVVCLLFMTAFTLSR